MKNKWQLFFALVVLFQLAVPAKMIWDQEYVLAEGQSFRFKTRAYDPNDPFRGKYIRLAFEADILEGNYLSTEGWERGDQVCVWLENDADGFAKIQRITADKPTQMVPHLQAELDYVRDNGATIRVKYPFEKFYMEESKAPAAEKYYFDLLRKGEKTVYALVKVHQGEGVLQDVQVDGQSLRDLVEEIPAK